MIVCDNSTDKKGTITGANVTPNQYYLYEQRAGAVVVDSGTFCLSSGSISGNTASGIMGGAGLTVEEGGKAFVGFNGNITDNVSQGAEGFDSKAFSAGVVVSGEFTNRGTISNNASLKYSTSAVFVDDLAKFTNYGTITHNVASKDVTKKGLDSFGCIYVSDTGAFSSQGVITENASNCATAAIYNVGYMDIAGKHEVYNNYYSPSYKTSSTSYDYNTVTSGVTGMRRDIFTNNTISVSGELSSIAITKLTEVSLHAAVTEVPRKGNVITRG